MLSARCQDLPHVSPCWGMEACLHVCCFVDQTLDVFQSQFSHLNPYLNPEDGIFPGEHQQGVNTVTNPFFLKPELWKWLSCLDRGKTRSSKGEKESPGSRRTRLKPQRYHLCTMQSQVGEKHCSRSLPSLPERHSSRSFRGTGTRFRIFLCQSCSIYRG